jgi:hypothetical protein
LIRPTLPDGGDQRFFAELGDQEGEDRIVEATSYRSLFEKDYGSSLHQQLRTKGMFT